MRAAVAAFLTAAGLAGAPSAAAGPPDWPPASAATIRPGAEMLTDGGQCTGNFIFYGAGEVYIGYAAHCATPPDGSVVGISEYCRTESLPLGTPVEIEGATRPGRLAYSSYAALIAAREEDIAVCNNNDFALVRIDPADHDKVNPTVPFWNGPTGLRRVGVGIGEKLLSYGNSGLRQGIEALKPREGYSTGDEDDGWAHHAHFVTTGIWGDSGSGVMDAAGSATGVLVTLTTLRPGGNGITDLALAVDYMESHGGPLVTLALGTEPFKGPQYGPAPVGSPEPQPDPEPPPPEPQQQQQQQQPPPPGTPPGGGEGPRGEQSPKPAARKRAKKRSAKRSRCRSRGANRRKSRGRRAPRCSKRRSQRERRARGGSGRGG